MMKYISMDDIVDICQANITPLKANRQGVAVSALRRVIEAAKEYAVEAEPAKHSHWFYPFSELDINRCWECGMHVQDKINNVRETFKYCPNCGAIMDGGAD